MSKNYQNHLREKKRIIKDDLPYKIIEIKKKKKRSLKYIIKLP